jgi:SOS response regulatory protein OraA/RecX
LERKGVEATIVAAALEPLDDALELAAARRAAAAWGTRRSVRSDQLARHLDRRGFGKRDILTVLEERFEEPSGSDDEGAEST